MNVQRLQEETEWKAVPCGTLAFLLGWMFGPSRSRGPALGELTSSSHSCLVLARTSSSELEPPSRLVVGSSWAGLGLDPWRTVEASEEGNLVLGSLVLSLLDYHIDGLQPLGMSFLCFELGLLILWLRIGEKVLEGFVI